MEIKARRIQFLNKRLRSNENGTSDSEENDDNIVVSEDENSDYTEDSFDKFLSSEESDLIK